MISIVVPCFNEEGNLSALLERIDSSLISIEHEIILVDDGSSDETYVVGCRLANKFKHVSMVRHNINQGIPEAWKTGIANSTFELICLIDADLQNPPEAIPEMYEHLIATQVDFVQGARSSIGRLKDQRMLFSRTLNFLLNQLFSQKSRDSKSGFIIGYKYAFNDVLNYKRSYRYFQTFLGVAARNKGYKVLEIETLFQSREIGKSFIANKKSILVILGVLLDFYPAILEFKNKENFVGETHIEVKKLRQKNLLRQIRFDLYFRTSFLHKWIISSNAQSLYYWLKATEYLSQDELKRLQEKRLKRLIFHSYHHVPYYKRKFNAHGINIQEFNSIEQLPFLTKSDVRKNIHFSMFSDSHNKKQMHRIQTSGSTGQPFVCYADKFQLEMRFATTLRALEMTGWRFGDKQLRLWHQTLGMSKKQAIQERIDAIFMRRTFVPAFEMTSDSVRKLFKLIERKRPILVDGYAESLNFLASGTDLSLNFSPTALMSSAQQLTADTRYKIESKFSSKVFDKYGSREFSGIAYQCTHSENHHVQEESYLVELLVDGRPAQPGEVGEIVITDLNNFSVPLIRYRIGDLAVAVEQTSCPCGRSHMQIGEITGRTQALVACSNDVWLPGTFFAHFFKDYDFAIRHYQVFQAEYGSFELRIIPTARYNNNIEEQIITELQKYTSAKTSIQVKLVNEIPMEKTGKRTPVISLVSQDYQSLASNQVIRNTTNT